MSPYEVPMGLFVISLIVTAVACFLFGMSSRKWNAEQDVELLRIELANAYGLLTELRKQPSDRPAPAPRPRRPVFDQRA